MAEISSTSLWEHRITGRKYSGKTWRKKEHFRHCIKCICYFGKRGNGRKGKKSSVGCRKNSGQVDLVADVDHSLATFAIADFPVEYKKDKKVIPAQVLMADFTPFDPASVDRMQRSQLWDCPDGEKLLDSCKYKLMLPISWLPDWNTSFVAVCSPAGWKLHLELFVIVWE